MTRWFLIVWVMQGGLGLSVTPMPTKKQCMTMAQEVLNVISTDGQVRAIAKCVETKP